MRPFRARFVTGSGRLVGYVVLALLGIGYLWLLWRWPLATVTVSTAVLLWSAMQARRTRRRLDQLAQGRVGESICTFVRALPVRELDTWVVRAVFEQLQAYLRITVRYTAFPLRPSDRLFEDLRITPEDLDDELVYEIAQRTGRALSSRHENPYYGKVTTVEDLIRFFCGQPRSAT